MTLDLRDELERATTGLMPPGDLADRAKFAGRRRLAMHRSRNILGGFAAVALVGAGIAALPSVPPATQVTPGASMTSEQSLASVSLPDPAPGFPHRLQPDTAPRLVTGDGDPYWSRSFSLAASPESVASDGSGVATGPEAVIVVGTFPMPGDGDTISGHRVSDRPKVAGTTGAVIEFEQTPGNPVTALYFRVGGITVAITGLYGATTDQLLALGNSIEGLPERTAQQSDAIAAAERRAQAQQRCQAAREQMPEGTELLHVSSTTVGAILTRASGPGGTAPAAASWASLPASDTAAWCTLRTGGTYTIVAATAGGPSITFVTSAQPLGDPGPDGPPLP